MEGTQPLAGIWQFRDKARRSVNSLLACVQVVPHTCQPHSCSSEFNAKFSNCVFLQEHRQQLFLWSSLLFWTFAQEMTDHRFPSPFFLIWSCRIYISDFWESAVPCCEGGRETILSVPQWHWTVGQQGQGEEIKIGVWLFSANWVSSSKPELKAARGLLSNGHFKLGAGSWSHKQNQWTSLRQL